MELETQVRELIAAACGTREALEPGTDLLERGLLDSLGLITLLEDLEELGVDLVSDEVDTIGGYLSMEAGHVPGPGEVFNLHGWAFTVLDADKKLIRRLRMEPADKAAQALDEAGDNAGA